MVDRNPLGQAQDPQRLVSNVRPVAITPAQYGVDTTRATGLAKANEMLGKLANVGLQIAQNKTKENEAALKDQGVAIALTKKDIILPELKQTMDEIAPIEQQQVELERKLNKDSMIPASQIQPWNHQESLQKAADREELKKLDTSLRPLISKREQLEIANNYIPKGNAAAKAYYDTKVISDLGNATLNLQAAIDANPMMTPAQIESLTQSIRGRYTKEFLQVGATDAAKYFSEGYDKVANEIKQTNYRNAINQVVDNTLITQALQVQQAALTPTTLATPTVVIPKAKPGLQSQNVTAIPPVDNNAKLTGEFGERRKNRPPGYKHQGIDLAIKAGSPVKVSVSGTVTKVGYDPGYGNFVFIKTVDGKETRYAHLESYNLTVGQKVGKGTILGKVGSTGQSTGPHLHFEVRDGKNIPIDPITYINNLNIPTPTKVTAMIASGAATTVKATTATPSASQQLRNTSVVEGLTSMFQAAGATKGSKPVYDTIDEVMKQYIDNGVPAERAYDILNQFIATAKENVVNTNKSGTDPSPAILTLRQLEKYKLEGSRTKLSIYEQKAANLAETKANLDTAQNRARDFEFFNAYTTRVSQGENPGVALAQVSTQLGVQPSRIVMNQITLYNQGVNTVYNRQQEQQNKANKASESYQKQQMAAQTKMDNDTVSTLKSDNVDGIYLRSLAKDNGINLQNTSSVFVDKVKNTAVEIARAKHLSTNKALIEAMKQEIKTNQVVTSPTNRGGATPTTVKRKPSNSRTAALGG